MSELLKVLKIDFEEQTVSARELYEEINNGKERFSKWFDRQLKFGFVDGEDFTSVLKSTVVNNGANKPLQDYNLSIDMAKQICMVQKTDKARNIRQQLIDLEKSWNTPEQVMARALKMADKTINSLKLEIEEQKPMVTFTNMVVNVSNTIDMGEMAKLCAKDGIRIGRNRLFEILREKGALMSNNIPYQRQIDNGIFKVVETIKSNFYCDQVFCKTLVTGKGQIKIVELLRKEFDK